MLLVGITFLLCFRLRYAGNPNLTLFILSSLMEYGTNAYNLQIAAVAKAVATGLPEK